MTQLLETIKIVDGTAPFVEFHNQRLNETRQILLNAKQPIDLKTVIQAPASTGIYRCRIIYSETIETVEYIRHQDRSFQTFKIVEDDKIDYSFKYLNRDDINRLVAQKGLADEILIIKNGLVTDTSIANVAFWQDQWLTPSTPLLKGTTRARLLKAKQLIEADIRREDLNRFSKMAMMNALIGFCVIENFKLIC
jgi:4-amino-4-deoxychorismate lyase